MPEKCECGRNMVVHWIPPIGACAQLEHQTWTEMNACRDFFRGERDKERGRAGQLEAEVLLMAENIAGLVKRAEKAEAALAAERMAGLSSTQQQHREWVKANFAHMTEREIGIAHAAGIAEEYFELGQAIAPIVRGAIKRLNGIRPETWSQEKIADALADMIIFACQLAESFEIDLGSVTSKVAKDVSQRDWAAYRAARGKDA